MRNISEKRKAEATTGKNLKKEKLKISLILASKNEEKYVERFFKAIKKQTRQPDEIIFVDSSTDRTAELAKPFVNKMLKMKPKSAGAARQLGFDNSSGNLIVFVDVDAEPHTDWLEKLVKAFENPDVHVAVGTVIFTEIKPMIPKPKGRIYMNHCNAAYRRHVIEEIPFDPDMMWDDAELGYRVGKKYILYGIPEAKVFHYATFDDYWQTRKKAGIGYIRLLKKYRLHPFWVGRIIYNLLYEGIIRLKPVGAIQGFAGIIYGLYHELFKEDKNKF